MRKIIILISIIFVYIKGIVWKTENDYDVFELLANSLSFFFRTHYIILERIVLIRLNQPELNLSKYSRLSITRTRKGNWNPFEFRRVRIIESNYRGNVTEGTEKSVRVMKVSSYRGSNYRESTVYTYVTSQNVLACDIL